MLSICNHQELAGKLLCNRFIMKNRPKNYCGVKSFINPKGMINNYEPSQNVVSCFSIIVLFWNSHQYIKECFTSIQNQTFNDFEIINPRVFINCVKEKFSVDLERGKPSIFIAGRPYRLIIPFQNSSMSLNNDILEKIPTCPGVVDIDGIVNNSKIILQNGNTTLDAFEDKNSLLEKVRSGKLPKGIVKNWSFYVAIPDEE